MVNMGIFNVLLECAYDLDILYSESLDPVYSTNGLSKELTTSCYILTNDGSLEIYVTEKIEVIGGEKVVVFKSTFNNNLINHGNDLIQDLIKGQLDVEAFLRHDDKYGEILCICESI